MAGSFEDFVGSRGGALWRLAWLLTGTDAAADERLDAALARVWPRWDELVGEADAFEAGVRRELVAAWLRGARTAAEPPESPAWPPPVAAGAHDGAGALAGEDVEERRRRTLAVLDALPARQRVAVALAGLPDLAVWDAADALDCSTAQLRRLEESAHAAALRDGPDSGRLLAGLDAVVPDPPYAGARAQRVRLRGAAQRRRRRRRTTAAGVLVVAAVTVPVLLSGGSDRPAPGASTPPGAATATVPAAERLVDPLPIPDRCAPLPDRLVPPAYPYEIDGADAAWLRFCPPPDVYGELDALPFAPDTTLVAQEVDELVDSWVTSEQGPNPCNYSAYEHQGLMRLQVGTLDGALHVVDIRVGTCGKVAVDGAELAVDGRTAFADVVTVLGSELLEDVAERGAEPPPVAAFCPDTVGGITALERTTVPDLPRVRGLALPLEARAALLCRYSPVPGAPGRIVLDDALLDPIEAERLRAAYLAHPSPAACDRGGRGSRYAVLLTDVTGSRRAFTVDLGRCAEIAGPGRARGTAGPWLSESLTLG